MRILDLAGSPAAMGNAHGAAHSEEIRTYAAERILLAGSEFWAGGEISRGDVLDIARSCLPAHEAHSPSLYEEMLSLIHIFRCRRRGECRSRWSPYH